MRRALVGVVVGVTALSAGLAVGADPLSPSRTMPVPTLEEFGDGDVNVNGTTFVGSELYVVNNASGNSRIHVLDPATGALKRSITPDFILGPDIASDGTSLFVAEAEPVEGRVHRIDPSTGATTATINVQGVTILGGIGGLTYLNGRLYMAAGTAECEGVSVVGMDAATGSGGTCFNVSAYGVISPREVTSTRTTLLVGGGFSRDSDIFTLHEFTPGGTLLDSTVLNEADTRTWGLSCGDGELFASDRQRGLILVYPFASCVEPLPEPDPDADGDGVADGIDVGDGAFSDPLPDGTVTAGRIVTTNGLDVTVSDVVEDPEVQGVRAVVADGSGQVELSVCSGYALVLDAGTDAVITCGSVKVNVLEGEARILLGDGSTVVTIPESGTAKVDSTGADTYVVENSGGIPVEVTVDGTTREVAPDSAAPLATWTFQGFTGVVDNPPVVNVVKAGRAIPLRWRIVGSDGRPVTTLSTARISVVGVGCGVGGAVDPVEQTTAGASGLLNLGDGTYQLNWKSPSGYAGSCRTLALDVGDGAAHTANFRFTR